MSIMMLSHITSRISSWLGSYTALCMLILKWSGTIQVLLIKGLCHHSSCYLWTPYGYQHVQTIWIDSMLGYSDHFIPAYNEICSSQQGRIIFTQWVLDEIFLTPCNIINALKNFLKIFESKNLTWIQGKNISAITKQLHATVVCLDEVWAWPDETSMEIFFEFLPSTIMMTLRQLSSTFQIRRESINSLQPHPLIFFF